MRRLISPLLLGSLLATAVAQASADEIERIAPGGNADRPFSEAVIYDDVIYLSGQLGVDPATRKLVEGGIGPETRQTLTNISDSLERLGASMEHVIKCTVFLADISEWGAMNTEYVTFFEGGKPARSAMGTGNGIALGARVEIECMAAEPDDDDDDEHKDHDEHGDHDAHEGHEDHEEHEGQEAHEHHEGHEDHHPASADTTEGDEEDTPPSPAAVAPATPAEPSEPAEAPEPAEPAEPAEEASESNSVATEQTEADISDTPESDTGAEATEARE